MLDIKRYECDIFGPCEEADGRFVLYEEHAKIVADLKAEIAERDARLEVYTDEGVEMGLYD